MRLLRKAIDEIEAASANLEEFDGLFPEPLTEDEQNLIGNYQDLILGIMLNLLEKGRTHLLIAGLEIPLRDPLAIDILTCQRCYEALGDTVEIDYQPGDFEDAGMECCIAHTNQVAQYGRAERREEFCPKDCDKHGQVCLPDICDHWNEQRCGGIGSHCDQE